MPGRARRHRTTGLAGIATAAWVLVQASGALAGLEIATETTFGEGADARTRSGRMLLDTNRLRMELPAQDAPDGRGLVLIFRGDLREAYVLDEKDRSYAKMDEASARQMRTRLEQAKREMDAEVAKLPPDERRAMEQMLAERGFGSGEAVEPAPKLRTKPSGKTATVAGRSCRELDLFEADRRIGDACIADWADTGTTSADFDPLREFAAFEEKMSKALAFGARRRAGNEMTVLFDLGGVPVRMRAERDGKLASETRLTDIHRRDLPADTFAPPADWKLRSAAP